MCKQSSHSTFLLDFPKGPSYGWKEFAHTIIKPLWKFYNHYQMHYLKYIGTNTPLLCCPTVKSKLQINRTDYNAERSSYLLPLVPTVYSYYSAVFILLLNSSVVFVGVYVEALDWKTRGLSDTLSLVPGWPCNLGHVILSLSSPCHIFCLFC